MLPLFGSAVKAHTGFMQPDQILRMANQRRAEELERASRRRLVSRPDIPDGSSTVPALRGTTRGTTHGADGTPRRTARPGTLRPIAITAAGLRTAASATGRALLAAWRFNAEVQRAILEAEQPWLREGPLRWQGSRRNPRLVGAHLPCAPGAVDAGCGARLHDSADTGRRSRRRNAGRAGVRPSSSPRRSL